MNVAVRGVVRVCKLRRSHFPLKTGLDCSVRVTSGSQRRAGLTSLRLSTGGGAGVTKGSRRQRDV